MFRLRQLLLLTSALAPLALSPAVAGPEGGSVVGGSATISNSGSGNVTVNQSSQNAVINWHTFNIGNGERTQFIQPNASSVILNRVTGGLGPSEILGTLDANGRVFVINRDGFLFGPNSVVNTAGFLATTHDIKNEDFMAGRFNFNIPGRNDASIVNLGTITAANGGFAALVAPGVRNSGTITANLGTVGLAASGSGFTLDFYGDKLITLGVGDNIANSVRDVQTGETLKSLVTNTGTLRANGGRVELTAASARQVVDSVINTSGVIEANSVGTKNGMIVLGAETAATKVAGAPKQTVKVSGVVRAKGNEANTKGGTILVTGEDIQITRATIDASGHSGGGKILIGGDWGGGNPNIGLVSNQSAMLESYKILNASTVTVDASSSINASATVRGDGGKVILWSDNTTSFAGTILALGGREFGNGGFAEVSGHDHLKFTGNVDTGAVNGRAGTLLLDPADYYIVTTLGSSPSGADEMTNTQLQALLATQNVVIATNNGSNPVGQNGDIFVNAPIAWNANTTLTLEAYRNIVLPDLGVNPNIKNTGGGNLVLRANSTGAFAVGSGDGTIKMPASTFSTRVDWSSSTGTITTYYNPSSYSTPTNFTVGNGRFVLASPSQLFSYMLVNSVGDLQNISLNTSGWYALSKDIDASGSFTPIPSFSGVLDGQGHTISNLTIYSPPTWNVGLFQTTAIGSEVRNLNFDNVWILANNAFPAHQYVGVVAGQAAGTISNVHVTSGDVNGSTLDGVIAGGLVGMVTGTIKDSSSAASVIVGSGNSYWNFAGGLAGRSDGGKIFNSSATGTVQGGARSLLGGLVGENEQYSLSGGTISNSWASGNVSGGGESYAGGLVGRNAIGTSIQSSYATGMVSVSGGGVGGGVNLAGGLVGENSGSISNSYATGPAAGSSTNLPSIVGGLVGQNNAQGTIFASYAGGNVSGDINSRVGGLAGVNYGLVDLSFATGDVTSGNVSGGLVGFNTGTVQSSYATGVVDGFIAGGLVGETFGGSILNSAASGRVHGNDSAGGLVGASESALIENSMAVGRVETTGVFGTAGGLVGGMINSTVRNSYAAGNVVGGNDAILGGLVGANVQGAIERSGALGTVTGGNDSFIGGLVGINLGSITQSFAYGAVTTGANGFAGGLVGMNFGVPGYPAIGTITQAYAVGAVTGGAGSTVGGLIGQNTGTVDQTYAVGLVTGGTGGIAGGLIGANSFNVPAALVGDPNIPTLVAQPGSVTNSYWDTQTTGQSQSDGGTGLTTAQLASGLPAGFSQTAWISGNGTNYPYLTGLPGTPPPANGGGGGGGVSDEEEKTKNNSQVQTIQNLVRDTILDPPNNGEVVNTSNATPTTTGSSSSGGSGNAPGGARPAGNQVPPPGLGPLPSGMPPLNETRFVNSEVVLQLGSNMTPEQVAGLARRLGLEIISQESVGLLGRTVYRFRLTGGQTVRDAIRTLEANNVNVSAQPSYQFTLAQDAVAQTDLAQADLAQATPAARTTGPVNQGDSAQYIVSKWRLPEVHVLARGTNVLVAVIDSAIDSNHPDLAGVIAGRFDAVGANEPPHAHGTGMAGAIASHARLLGVAPGARLLAIRAFGVNTTGAQGTSMNIVKGLDWAVSQGAKIINMSFAGPRDPILQQAIRALHDKGIVLIAAAGNAGPRSPPLFPGADPNVIAVSATDVADKTYVNANRGKYLAVAAPGVDVLVPAPDGYQLTTGTSVAAAHISGVAALMLERNPSLKPDEVRNILMTTAKNVNRPREEVGMGLADPLAALAKADPKAAAR